MRSAEHDPGERISLLAGWRLLRASVRGEYRDYTTGSIRAAVVLLAIPMMLEMVMESAFAITDIFFVSALGANAIAAVGLTEAILTLVYAVAIGIGMGATALVARRVGEKDREGAAVAAAHTLWLGAATAVAVGLTGGLLAESILRAMGADADVIDMGSGYTRVMLGGSGTIVFLFLVTAVFRGAGNPAIAMRALWIANGINIVLDPCLIFGIGPFPELGVTGAAVASNCGRGIGVGYLFWKLFVRTGYIRISRRHLAGTMGGMLTLLRISSGGIAQFAIATASWVVMMRLVASYGSAAIAGYTIAIRVIDVTILPAWGMSNAAATLVGQNLGAGKPDRAEQCVWQTARYAMLFMLVVAVVLVVFATPITAFFSADANVVHHGALCLFFFAWGFPLYGLGLVLTQAFNGAGDTFTPTGVNLFCFWLVQIPLALALSQTFKLGPAGVFAAVLVAESLVAPAAFLVFRRGLWRERRP